MKCASEEVDISLKGAGTGDEAAEKMSQFLIVNFGVIHPLP